MAATNSALSTTAPAWRALQALDKFKQTGPSQFEARCPTHDDRKPSLSIGIDAAGVIGLTCHGPCDTSTVVAALGCELADLFPPKATKPGARPKRRIVATYDYRDESGVLLYQAVRYLPKDFQQRRPDGHDDWIWKLGDTRRVPYRLPEILADTSGELWLFEGEKDADRAAALGLCATTTAQGAASFGKTAEAMRAAARDKHVHIVQDEDDGGDIYAAAALAVLRPVATSVSIVHLPRLTHTADHGEDFSDWLETYGGSVEELRTLAGERTAGPEQEEDDDEDEVDEDEVDEDEVDEDEVDEEEDVSASGERRINVDEVHLASELGQQRGQHVLLVAPDQAITPLGWASLRPEIVLVRAHLRRLIDALHSLEGKRDTHRCDPLAVLVLAFPDQFGHAAASLVNETRAAPV